MIGLVRMPFAHRALQQEIVGTYTALTESTTMSVEHMSICLMEFMKLLGRQKAHEDFRAEIDAMRPLLDSVLMKAFARQSSRKVDAFLWMQAHAHHLMVVCNAIDIEPVLECDKAWGTVSSQIQRLASASKTAAAIFNSVNVDGSLDGLPALANKQLLQMVGSNFSDDSRKAFLKLRSDRDP